MRWLLVCLLLVVLLWCLLLLLQDIPLQQSVEMYLDGIGRPGMVNAFALWLEFFEQHHPAAATPAKAPEESTAAADAEANKGGVQKEKTLPSSQNAHACVYANGSASATRNGWQHQHRPKRQQQRLFFSTSPHAETPDSYSRETEKGVASAPAIAVADGRHRGKRQVKQGLFWVSPVLIQHGERLRVKLVQKPTRLSIR